MFLDGFPNVEKPEPGFDYVSNLQHVKISLLFHQINLSELQGQTQTIKLSDGKFFGLDRLLFRLSGKFAKLVTQIRIKLFTLRILFLKRF
ncbi:hypothetical protein [Nostoc sp. ChiVER01]|uniref:hypothetical protein n=1 Tax=Nostoc sp. ChiVER01 TaxID=3075382 RepID=UPI002AD26AE9|nr:hypothetical protein [Nostoc sp. ChiVER01]MDZ8226134.1 hypothetical protein [Nostoc sp. ChiVER01]